MTTPTPTEPRDGDPVRQALRRRRQTAGQTARRLLARWGVMPEPRARQDPPRE